MKIYYIYAKHDPNQPMPVGSSATTEEPYGRYTDKAQADTDCARLNREKSPNHPGCVVEERDK